MKLQCKICGSFNLTNKDNQIVCDDCGCKYPIEEAKNLLQNDNTAAPSQTTQIPYTEQERKPKLREEEKKNSNNTAIGVLIACLIVALVIIIIILSQFDNKPPINTGNVGNNQTSTTTSTTTGTTEPPEPKIIVLTDENIHEYCDITYTVTPDAYKESLIANGYQEITTWVTIKGKTSRYKFKNVQIDVRVNIKADVTSYNILSKETNIENIYADLYTSLNENGNATKGTTYVLTNNDLIEKKSSIKTSYTYTVKSGYLELIE